MSKIYILVKVEFRVDSSVSLQCAGVIFPPSATRANFLLLSVEILEIIRVILKLYDQWKNFDDRKEIAAVLNKMPKPKPPPNR